MVYFTCNNCGDSLQKPKVQKHYQTACSRNPINLTCVDCHKDFGEKEYVAHVKCVTEMERYSDKSYVAKTNKGEAKQSSWIDAIQSVINESNARPAVKEVLQKLATFENVPRKKAKFFNFMKNCAVSRTKDDVLEEVWSLLEKQKDKIKKEPETNNKNSNEEVSEKLNGCEGEKNNKRKLENDDSDHVSKVHKIEENDTPTNVDNKLETPEENLVGDQNGDTKSNVKFEWKKEITNCLNSNDNEISMKSLRKKLVESYLLTVDFDKYFMKKLNKIKGVTIENNIVKLNK
ncbi:uncharacterized protein C16C10.8-like [Ctenocephalides felis]|uniref:uncharacterized protein C16C10.8-like n=1 Tax=Ctenocephalides felis TaxID=7515 RepID=UPI000E6E43B8|nr:uncharacterized protein C16C10.8-like [Ctenocephalides felis]